eukprot:3330934-Rhodomonas_salina.2
MLQLFTRHARGEQVAAAASGKAGGFLARGWGNGATRQLHELSFDLHEQVTHPKSPARPLKSPARHPKSI